MVEFPIRGRRQMIGKRFIYRRLADDDRMLRRFFAGHRPGGG